MRKKLLAAAIAAVLCPLTFTAPNAQAAGLAGAVSKAMASGAVALITSGGGSDTDIGKLEVENHASVGQDIEVDTGVLRMGAVSLHDVRADRVTIDLNTDIGGNIRVEKGWMDLNTVSLEGQFGTVDVTQEVVVEGDVTCKFAYCAIGAVKVD